MSYEIVGPLNNIELNTDSIPVLVEQMKRIENLLQRILDSIEEKQLNKKP